MQFTNRVSWLFAFSTILLDIASSGAQVSYESAPINYAQTQPNDLVAQLALAIERGDKHLSYSDEHGWLPSLLQALDISPESQLLVFSKTSLQLHKISPRTPRALYFNDEVYVGWCQRGDVIELTATDPSLGAVFYTLEQQSGELPIIKRDRGGCLTCHATQRTQGVPGLLVRSIYPDFNGRPRGGTRTYVTDHTSDFKNRFGGWYVTGDHGEMRHMGNVIARDRLAPETIDRDAGANRSTVRDMCEPSAYLSEHSDIVALMILEHQSQMHNLIARASIETRIATHYDRGINEALDRPLDTVSPSTERRIASASEKLVRYMLFADEHELTSPIVGSSRFAEYFQSLAQRCGQVDSRNRSLRQLDLRTRMFQFPCSYLIYTAAFDALPEPAASYVRNRLSEILKSATPVEGYERLDDEQRRAIIEILAETKPGYILE